MHSPPNRTTTCTSSSDTSGYSTGLNPVVVPHTTGLRHVVVPHTTIKTQLVTVVAGRLRVATRGGCRTQHANYVRTTRTVRRPSSNYDTSGHTTGLNPVVVPHTTGLNPVVVPHTTIKTQLVTVVAGRPRITTRGGCRTQHANSAQRP